MVWCGVVWCGVVWFGVVRCGVVWCGVVWSPVVWYCVVWCGVVWCGLVWCGVVWCVHVHGLLLTRPLPQARLRGLRAMSRFQERPELIGGGHASPQAPSACFHPPGTPVRGSLSMTKRVTTPQASITTSYFPPAVAVWGQGLSLNVHTLFIHLS